MNKHVTTLALFLGAALLGGGHLMATTYNVVVNTASLNGTLGAIDFQFNQGGTSAQSATVQISNFLGGGPGTGQQLFGGASGGPEPAAITLTNAAGDNEAFDSYAFAQTLSFTLNFTGPGVTSPSGSTAVSSLFTFMVYSDAAGNSEALTSNPNGALSISLNPQGLLTPSINSPAVQITPEPGSIDLIIAPLASLTALGMKRRAASSESKP